MQNIILKALLFLFENCFNRVAARFKAQRIYAWRKDGEHYAVGYWAKDGRFITHSVHGSESDAMEACEALNNAS